MVLGHICNIMMLPCPGATAKKRLFATSRPNATFVSAMRPNSAAGAPRWRHTSSAKANRGPARSWELLLTPITRRRKEKPVPCGPRSSSPTRPTFKAHVSASAAGASAAGMTQENTPAHRLQTLHTTGSRNPAGSHAPAARRAALEAPHGPLSQGPSGRYVLH